ncbi:MAG TPA: aldose 1-epimerase [Casimicrobiaceae bacterium]|nr:aldose 1-epimerase [Casimicrobiaceae bacterium]
MRILELTTAAASVAIAPELGGAIIRFAVDGEPVLRPTSDAALAARDVRRTACYPLVPYSNRIRNAELDFAGRRYPLQRNFGAHPHAIHGVGWQRAWTVADAFPCHARLTLHHDAQGENARAWPWPFAATQAFHLADVAAGEHPHAASLVVTLTLKNTSGAAFPFGLGFHPFFPKEAATRLCFEAERVWESDATQLPRTLVDVPAQWQFGHGRALDAIALDNVFTGWGRSATLVDDARSTTVRIDADRALAYAVVYAPANADFVAIEPVTHETDAFNRSAAGATGTGMRVLPPGAAFSCTMRVKAAAAAPAAPSHPVR